MKITVFLLSLLAAGSSAAGEADYTCKSFVADYEKVVQGQKPDPANTVFLYVVGILTGAFHAKTEVPFVWEDTSALGRFEKAVATECEKMPAARTTSVIFRLAKSLDRDTRPVPPTEYQAMTVTDFRLDAKQLRGKKIELSGMLQVLGDMAMIGEELFTTNKVMVEIKGLPRDSRKFILENCESGCSIVVRGKAGNVMLNDGLIAEEISNP